MLWLVDVDDACDATSWSWMRLLLRYFLRAVSFLSVNFVIQEELEGRLVVVSQVPSRGEPRDSHHGQICGLWIDSGRWVVWGVWWDLVCWKRCRYL